jgi:hypothetical protein
MNPFLLHIPSARNATPPEGERVLWYSCGNQIAFPQRPFESLVELTREKAILSKTNIQVFLTFSKKVQTRKPRSTHRRDNEHQEGGHMRGVLRQVGAGLIVSAAVMMAWAEDVSGPNPSGDLSAANSSPAAPEEGVALERGGLARATTCPRSLIAVLRWRFRPASRGRSSYHPARGRRGSRQRQSGSRLPMC